MARSSSLQDGDDISSPCHSGKGASAPKATVLYLCPNDKGMPAEQKPLLLREKIWRDLFMDGTNQSGSHALSTSCTSPRVPQPSVLNSCSHTASALLKVVSAVSEGDAAPASSSLKLREEVRGVNFISSLHRHTTNEDRDDRRPTLGEEGNGVKRNT